MATVFNLFRRSAQTEQPVQLTAQDAGGEKRSLGITLLDIFGGVPVAAGVSVNAQTAYRIPAVMAGIKALAEASSILPLHAFRRNSDGSRDRDTSHVAFKLLNGPANPWTLGPQLRELLTADAIAYGNGCALILRDGEGQPTELHRLHPQTVTVELDSLTSEPRYKVQGRSGSQVYGLGDVLHLRAPCHLSTDSVSGRSPLLEAKDALGLLIVLQQHASQLFKNGTRPSGIIRFPGTLGAVAEEKMRKSWQAMTSGSSAGGTAVLEEGGEFQSLSFKSVDTQFLEIWSLAITEVARVLRVPPALLMDFSRQTWNNAEFSGQLFLTYSLAPWLSRWEAEVTLKLIAPEDREAVFVEHLTDALLKSDFASRATAFSQYRAAGVLTGNDVRKALNYPPLPGGDGLQNPYTTTVTSKTEPAK